MTIDGNPRCKEVSVSQIVKENTRLYGEDIIEQQFPSAIDGFKKVIRRCVWILRTHEDKVKSSFVVGKVMGIHPHGDASIYKVLCRLCQRWAYNPPLAVLEGNIGSYSGEPAAASRYTEMSISEFGKDLFFRGIDIRALHMVMDESQSGYEPIHLVPAIPTALLYGNYTVGFGFASNTPPMHLDDLCDVCEAYINHMKVSPHRGFDYKKHVSKFVPDFPIPNILTNYDELIEAYQKGNFAATICLDGIVELSSDTIRIMTLSAQAPFGMLEEILHKELRIKDSYCDRNIVGMNNFGNESVFADITITLKKKSNVFEVWDVIREMVQFSGNITPILNYVTESDLIETISPVTVLEKWYKKRYELILASKKYELSTLNIELRGAQARLIICGHTDKVIKIIRGHDLADAIAILKKEFDLTEYQAHYLCKAQISILSKSSPAELQREHDEIQQRITTILTSFQNIPDEMINTIVKIRQKYKIPRTTIIPKYIGYVGIGKGCVQFESTDEIPGIIDRFSKDDIRIHMYNGPHLYRVTDNNKFDNNIPKYTTGDIYGLPHTLSDTYTVNIDNGCACVVKGFVPGLRSEGYFYTTKKSKAIYRSGLVKTIDATKDIALRKTICRGTLTDLIKVYPDIGKDHYVVCLNTESPNILVLQRIGSSDTNVVVSPIGDMEVIHSYSGKSWYLNIDPKYLNRNTTRIVHIKDAEKILDGRSQIRIDINIDKWKRNPLLQFI